MKTKLAINSKQQGNSQSDGMVLNDTVAKIDSKQDGWPINKDL